jgi:hypothetical protein
VQHLQDALQRDVISAGQAGSRVNQTAQVVQVNAACRAQAGGQHQAK